MKQIYLHEFERVAISTFSMWNREPASPSYGSFDRPYWGWKYKDLSDATLQCAVKLAVEYARLIGRTDTLPALLERYVVFCRSIQWRDGSFDQCYPRERTPGPIYDILSTFVYVRNSPFLESPTARTELDGVMERALQFALRTDEKHGEVANHIAHFAYELLYYAEFSGDPKARARGLSYLDRLLSLFNRDEGWFREYHGPDPGYQTRCLRYLVKIAGLLGQAELWQVVRQAADFVWELLMPDGSIHPMLGCRSTALLYPSPFERLAVEDHSYRGLAALVRQGWCNGRVPLPSSLDFGNAIRLADDAFDAAGILSQNGDQGVQPEIRQGDRHFTEAGIVIRRTTDVALYLGYCLGGVIVLYNHRGDNWRLSYEDSGFMIESNNQRWVNRMPDSGQLLELGTDRIKIRSKFFLSLHDELTPVRLVVLRLLNFTVLRFQWFADVFRRLVVRRLMSGVNIAPAGLLREVLFSGGAMTVIDKFETTEPWHNASLFRCRRVIGAHMASSRYFQQQELESMDIGWSEKTPFPPGTDLKIQVKPTSVTD
jgi:hypothetical protein